MSDQAPNAELLRSLGKLARGLSALFWGLPFCLIICVQTAKMDTLKSFNVIPPLAVTGWICAGLWQLGHFQKQERVWRKALDRARILAMVNFGLSPFLYWWSKVPDEPFFTIMISILAVCGLLFLADLNAVLYRLSAMLPDESIRQETRHFTTMNRYIVFIILVVGLALSFALRYPMLLPANFQFDMILNPGSLWLMVFLVLLPLAMTMALIWKMKETILESLFSAGH